MEVWIVHIYYPPIDTGTFNLISVVCRGLGRTNRDGSDLTMRRGVVGLAGSGGASRRLRWTTTSPPPSCHFRGPRTFPEKYVCLGTVDKREFSEVVQARCRTAMAHHQRSVVDFLDTVARSEVRTGIIVQRVEELLLELVSTKPLNDEDGSLAIDLLSVARRNVDGDIERSAYHKLPKLFSLTTEILIDCGHPSARKEVDQLFWELLQNPRQFFSPDLRYNSAHVNAVFARLVISTATLSPRGLDHQTRRRINKYISAMESLWGDHDVPLMPSPEAYHAIILFLCHDQKPDQAYKWLMRLVDVQASGKFPVPLKPRTSSCALIISAFSRQGNFRKANKLIEWMLESEADAHIPKPDTICFNGLLDGWAKSSSRRAAYEVEQVIEQMKELHRTEGLDTCPTEYSYNICINAWANTPGRDSAQRAEDILLRLMQDYQNGGDIGPTATTFATVMNAWASSKHKDAPERAESVLRSYEQMATMDEDTQVQLNVIPYTVMIKAWGLAGKNRDHRGAALCLEKILVLIDRMHDLELLPTAEVNLSIVTALQMVSPLHGVLYFLKLEDAYRRGEAELNTPCFNCGMNAIASFNKPDLTGKAFSLLRRMEHYGQTDDRVAPNVSTYNTMLKIMSRSPEDDSATKAQSLLMKMHSMHSVKPDRVSYLTCILAWGRSKDENKFDRVKELLEHYEDRWIKKDLADEISVTPFNAALSVCYHNSDVPQNSKILGMALDIMNRIRSSNKLRPDDRTYCGLLNTIGKVAPDSVERKRLLALEFSSCIEDGLVSREIANVVEEYSPGLIAELLINESERETTKIPSKWRRNVGSHKSGM